MTSSGPATRKRPGPGPGGISSMASADRNVAFGYCHCGCGELAPIAAYTRRAQGHVKGQPVRYVAGHQRRSSPVEYIEQEGGYDTPCWVWQRACYHDGYGVKWVAGRQVRAHRFYYEREYGPIPDGLVVDHLCRNRRCVNPGHLAVVSNVENLRRGEGVRLTADDVREIFAQPTASATALARRYGVARGAIYAVRTGTAWTDVTGLPNRDPRRR